MEHAMGDETRARRRTWVLLIVGALVVAGIVILWGGVQLGRPADPVVSETAAVSMARAFFLDMQPAGVSVDHVRVDGVALQRDGAGRPVWDVRISGDVVEAGETMPTYASHLILRVDGQNGEVTVFAQG